MTHIDVPTWARFIAKRYADGYPQGPQARLHAEALDRYAESEARRLSAKSGGRKSPAYYHEAEIQAALVAVLEALKAVGWIAAYHHTPNGGKRSKRVASQLKRLGTQPGVPDLYVLLPGGKHCWIEMKRPKWPGRKGDRGGVLDDAQKLRMKELTAGGALCHVSTSVTDALAWLVGVREDQDEYRM